MSLGCCWMLEPEALAVVVDAHDAGCHGGGDYSKELGVALGPLVASGPSRAGLPGAPRRERVMRARVAHVSSQSI